MKSELDKFLCKVKVKILKNFFMNLEVRKSENVPTGSSVYLLRVEICCLT